MRPIRLAEGPSCCLNCLRRSLRGSIANQTLPGVVQVRSKKKVAKRQTINVRLLKDTNGYGPKGSIVPITRGVFRNSWLPTRRAEYLPDQLSVSGSKVDAARDYQYKKDEEAATEQDQDAAVPTVLRPSIPQLTPAQATELLDNHLPPTIEIRSTVISENRSATRPSGGGAIAEQSERRLFGSVTTDDIAAKIKDILKLTEGKDIPLKAADISILSPGVDGQRESIKVKNLGTYSVRIYVDGGAPLIRMLEVKPTFDEPLPSMEIPSLAEDADFGEPGLESRGPQAAANA